MGSSTSSIEVYIGAQTSQLTELDIRPTVFQVEVQAILTYARKKPSNWF